MRRAAEKRPRTVGWRPVEYVDRSYEGHIGPFRKFAEFAHQQELRLAVGDGDGAPLRLSIGGIRDICQSHPAQHFRHGYIDAAEGTISVKITHD